MYFCLSVLPSSKHKIILLLKHRCVDFISIKLRAMSKSNQKIGKTRNYPCAWKGYSTSRTGIGRCKKKEVTIDSKTAALSYFDKWKKKQQDQVGKYFYFSFVSQLWSNDYLPSPIYVRLPSEKYFTASFVLKILSFWYKFRIIIFFVIAKK